MLCAIWYHSHNLKNVKNIHGGVLLLLKVALLKVTLFHGCFSRFLNCAHSTKSSKAPQIMKLSQLMIPARSQWVFCSIFLPNVSTYNNWKLVICFALLRKFAIYSHSNHNVPLSLHSGWRGLILAFIYDILPCEILLIHQYHHPSDTVNTNIFLVIIIIIITIVNNHDYHHHHCHHHHHNCFEFLFMPHYPHPQNTVIIIISSSSNNSADKIHLKLKDLRSTWRYWWVPWLDDKISFRIVDALQWLK